MRETPTARGGSRSRSHWSLGGARPHGGPDDVAEEGRNARPASDQSDRHVQRADPQRIARRQESVRSRRLEGLGWTRSIERREAAGFAEEWDPVRNVHREVDDQSRRRRRADRLIQVHGSMRSVLVVAASLAAAAAVSGAAGAHVQVSPAEVAPGDSTLFTLLVPNEKDRPTTEVELKVPAGVIVFSFRGTPGWKRSETRRANGSLDVVSWKGSLPPEEFVQFAFLASTPEQEGQISWPAVQTYRGGEKVRWIGPPDSEEPAAVTLVTTSASTENAGGEEASGQQAGATTPPTRPTGGDDDSTSWLSIIALVVGGLGLVIGLGALAQARRWRREA